MGETCITEISCKTWSVGPLAIPCSLSGQDSLFCFSFIFLSLKDGKLTHLAPRVRNMPLVGHQWPGHWPDSLFHMLNFIPSNGGLRHGGVMRRSSLGKLHLPQTQGSPLRSQGSAHESHFLLYPQIKVAGEQLCVNVVMWDLQPLSVLHASEQPFRSKTRPIKKVNTSFAGTLPGCHQPLLHKQLWELFQQHISASGM